MIKYLERGNKLSLLKKKFYQKHLSRMKKKSVIKKKIHDFFPKERALLRDIKKHLSSTSLIVLLSPTKSHQTMDHVMN